MDEDRWAYLLALDDELLIGGVIVSEWSAYLIRQADIAYSANADLAALLTGQAAIESHLRFMGFGAKAGTNFFNLIERSDFSPEIKAGLHEIRRFRNSWVHIADPEDDADLLAHPERHDEFISAMAKKAMRLVRVVAYADQSL